MGRLIVATGLGGWAGIVALAWWLTYRGIMANCSTAGELCVQMQWWKLNGILISGLTVALVFTLGCMCVYAIARKRQRNAPINSKGWTATQDARARLR